MKTVVIYHAGCWDGFCAAWVCRKVYPDAEFYPARHGEDPPFVQGKNVIIVDFCYPFDVMQKILKESHSLTVLDHHKTAEATLQELVKSALDNPPNVCFDLNRSGGRLAWDYFFSGQVPPDLVAFTEDRDLWKWNLILSREFNAALRSYPLDFTVWDELGEKNFHDFVAEGEAILRYQREVVASQVRHARIQAIGVHDVPTVNSTVLISEIGEELSKGHPFAAVYFDSGDGRRHYSLRSQPDGVDVSEIAMQFGGGGHKHAAGFSKPCPW